MSNTNLKKKKEGYGYKYTELSQINDYIESIGETYTQYIVRIENDDYIFTQRFGEQAPKEPLQGCRVVQATLNGKSNPAQEQGSALTYARRYSLLMAYGLATTDDDAALLDRKKDTKDNVPTTKFKDLNNLMLETNTDYDEFCLYFKVDEIEKLTDSQIKIAMALLEKKRNNNEN